MRNVNSQSTRRNCESGFTIFEVLMSVVLLSIGLMALAGMQVLGVRGNVDGEDRSIAASIASAKINEFMTVPYYQNSETGESNWDAILNATTGMAEGVRVNHMGMTAEELQTRFPSGDISKEQFRYTLQWQIEDMGDQTMPGAWKRVTILVSWTDRSVQAAGERGQIAVSGIPISPQYL